jgi:PKD repeat protein
MSTRVSAKFATRRWVNPSWASRLIRGTAVALLTISACRCQREAPPVEQVGGGPPRHIMPRVNPTEAARAEVRLRHLDEAAAQFPSTAPQAPPVAVPDVCQAGGIDAGLECADQLNREVETRGPEVSSFEANPAFGGAPLTVDLSIRVLNKPDDLKLHWNFGDGYDVDGDEVTQHIYTEAGLFMPKVTLSWSGGHLEMPLGAIQVQANSFIVQIIANPPAGMAPLAVSFTATAVSTGVPGPDQEDLRYEWEFGDGVRGFGPETDHRYDQAGTYKTTVVVTDKAGKQGRGEMDVTVLPSVEDMMAGATDGQAVP